MSTLAQNMAYLLKAQTAANDAGIRKPEHEKNGIYEFHGLEEKIVEADWAVSAKPPAKMSCPPTSSNTRCLISDIPQKRFQPFKRNDVHLIVEIGVICAGDNEQLLVVPGQLVVRRFAENSESVPFRHAPAAQQIGSRCRIARSAYSGKKVKRSRSDHCWSPGCGDDSRGACFVVRKRASPNWQFIRGHINLPLVKHLVLSFIIMAVQKSRAWD